MTTRQGLEEGIASGNVLLFPRLDCEFDFHDVRDAIAALEFIRRGLEHPRATVDVRELTRAIDYALLPARTACESLGVKLGLIKG